MVLHYLKSERLVEFFIAGCGYELYPVNAEFEGFFNKFSDYCPADAVTLKLFENGYILNTAVGNAVREQSAHADYF